MAQWSDLFKLWKLATDAGPLERRERGRNIEGAGVVDAQAIPDIRADGSFGGGSRALIQMRDSRDFIDLSSVTNRSSRYKEYDRLRIVPEIETAMTVFADETCVVGATPIATPFGYIPIGELAEKRKPDERFLIYCYDFKKGDFTLGWAFNPRKTKKEWTKKIIFQDGTHYSSTLDHRILLKNGQWTTTGELEIGDEIMPFYRVHANQELTKSKKHQYARIWTKIDGWKAEKDFIQEWRTGKKAPKKETLYKLLRLCNSNLLSGDIASLMGRTWPALQERLSWTGFSLKEMQVYREKYPPARRVVGVWMDGQQDVYDLSVQDHENFATSTGIFHNCQTGENGHMIDINVKNPDVKKELEDLFFHPSRLNIDRKLFTWAKNLYIYGDHFLELVIDPENPKDGICNVMPLPADSMYRIETIKCKLIEFQQSKEGPDYQSLSRVEVTKASSEELNQATAIRFSPKSIVHMRIGEDRRTFYPYGVSMIEQARGPAHQLRLMEDAMMVYRLSRAAERRVWYVDVGNMPPFKAEAFVDRLKDQLRKRKTYSSKGGAGSNSTVEERWQAPSQDEDFWIPVRPNANTRVETLPGAANLDAIGDVDFIRNKLFIALNFPKNYMAQEDVSITRATLSSVDVKFARFVERLQMSIVDGILEMAIRHLELMGFPTHLYDDLQIKMTPPSHWREISENEVIEARFNRAISVKGSQLYADLDIFMKILKIPADDAKEMVARSTIQKLQDLKLQLMSQNPELMGVAMPGNTGQEMGTEAGGPNPMLTGQEGQPDQGMEPGQATTPPEQEQRGANDTFGKPQKQQPALLPDATEEEIKRYDLGIADYSKDIDEEEIDNIELEA